MRAWLTLLAAGASLSLASCATAPTPDPWADLEVDQTEAQRPVRLPEWPDETSFTEDEITFDLSGARALSAYRATGEGNTEIADANAEQIDELRKAAAALVEAGQAQRRVADLRLEILQEERRHHAWERAGYWTGMLLVIIGAAAL